VISFLELREPARPAPRRASERTAQAHGVSLGL
jgi:hypothetical protein